MLMFSGSLHVRSLRGLIPSPKTVGERRRGRSRPATCRKMGLPLFHVQERGILVPPLRTSSKVGLAHRVP